MNDMGKPKTGGMSPGRVHAIGGVCCGLMLAGAWFFGVGPAIQSRAQATSQRVAITTSEEEAERLHARVVGLERELNQVLQEEKLSPLRLEPASYINTRLSDISKLASEAGLDLASIRPGQVIRSQRFQVVPIELSGSGSYKDCTVFLNTANERFPDMGVALVDVKRRLNNVGGGADFQFTFVWYAAASGGRAQTAGVETD